MEKVMAYLKKNQIMNLELKHNIFDRFCKRLDVVEEKMSEMKDMHFISNL